jgi:hypothetical protein
MLKQVQHDDVESEKSKNIPPFPILIACLENKFVPPG